MLDVERFKALASSGDCECELMGMLYIGCTGCHKDAGQGEGKCQEPAESAHP